MTGPTRERNDLDVLIGTPAQVRWARAIRAHFRAFAPPDLLPYVPLAAFWIDHRDAASLRELWDAAVSLDRQLLYSPFVSHYPRWGRAEAVITLRLLDRHKIVDVETDGIGKTSQVLDVAMVDQDGVPLFTSIIRQRTCRSWKAMKGSAQRQPTVSHPLWCVTRRHSRTCGRDW
jgi:hypothetical protein